MQFETNYVVDFISDFIHTAILESPCAGYILYVERVVFSVLISGYFVHISKYFKLLHNILLLLLLHFILKW